jgi:hypothetical protein
MQTCSRILYKYLPSSRATVLLDGRIRFSQVGALNDPFESRAILDTEPLVEEFVEKYVRELDGVAEQWNNGILSEDEAAQLNKAKGDLEAYARRRINSARIGRDAMRFINSSLGVLSLSRTRTSLLLWAHYAEAHTGFVIGLDEEDHFFSEPDQMGRPSKVHEVLYSQSRLKAAYGIPTDVDYQTLLCQKSDVWEYEQEVRVFRVLPQTVPKAKDALGYPVHLFSLKKAGIREVIFGANSSYTLQVKLRRYLKRQSISARVYKARISDVSFDINLQEVGLQRYRDEGYYDISYHLIGCAHMLHAEVLAVLETEFVTAMSDYIGYGAPLPSVAAIIGLGNALP